MRYIAYFIRPVLGRYRILGHAHRSIFSYKEAYIRKYRPVSEDTISPEAKLRAILYPRTQAQVYIYIYIKAYNYTKIYYGLTVA